MPKAKNALCHIKKISVCLHKKGQLMQDKHNVDVVNFVGLGRVKEEMHKKKFFTVLNIAFVMIVFATVVLMVGFW